MFTTKITDGLSTILGKYMIQRMLVTSTDEKSTPKADVLRGGLPTLCQVLSSRDGTFKLQVQDPWKKAMEKMENKERFPLSHGTATAICMNLFTRFVALGI
jgi:hypothetical protein